LCSAFSDGLNYDYFTEGNSISHPFVDTSVTSLSYTKGFKPTDDTYKYFLPLFIQDSVADPTRYTITAEIKIGGMIKTLSQDFILVSDTVVAPEGTMLWGLINAAYVEQFGNNFNNYPFYKSICFILTGTISVEGKYNDNATWKTVADNIDQLTTLVYNGESILKSLPNITGINLYNASEIPTEQEGVINIDLSNTTKLVNVNLQRCSQLSGEIDLSHNENINQVNFNNTSLNVKLSKSCSIEKLYLGNPTKIEIDTPLKLKASNIYV
jgi:hypothetical protein